MHWSAWKDDSPTLNFHFTAFSRKLVYPDSSGVHSAHEEKAGLYTRPSSFVRVPLPKKLLRGPVPLAASLHLSQDFIGAVEAFAAGVPDLLHQLLRGPVPLGG
jgi:hypothetical protein